MPSTIETTPNAADATGRHRHKRPPAGFWLRVAGRLRRTLQPGGCWSIRCILYRLHVWRRTRITRGGNTWLRTTVLGIRVTEDRWVHDER